MSGDEDLSLTAGLAAQPPSDFTDPAQLLAALGQEGAEEGLEALDYVVAHPDEAAPVLLASLERVLAALRAHDDDPSEVDEADANPLWVGLMLLGELRHTAAHEAIVALSRRPGPVLDDLLGELVTEGLQQILWRTSGGRLDAILGLLDDPEASIWARTAAARALATGVHEDELDHDTAVELLRERLVFPGDPRMAQFSEDTLHQSSAAGFDDMLVSVLAHLWPERALAEIRRVFAVFRLDERFPYVSLDAIEEIVGTGREAHLLAERALNDRVWLNDLRVVGDYLAGRLQRTPPAPPSTPAPSPTRTRRRDDPQRRSLKRKDQRKARKRNRRK